MNSLTTEILNALIPILICIESNGNPSAIGDNGKAIGILQIHCRTVEDINRIIGENRFTYDDRYDWDKSIEMCVIYLQYYYASFVRWYNKPNTYTPSVNADNPYEICARLWNGGYYGTKYNPRATDSYWDKVEDRLEEHFTDVSSEVFY